MADLSAEIVLVTGASRGIGAAIAERLRADGATVIGTATTQSGADALGKSLATPGQVLDVGDPESIAAMVKRLGEDKLMPSVLVNNAAITRDMLIMRMKDDDWNAVMQTNLGGVFMLTKVCMRGMLKARHGRIINLTSIVGFTGNAGQANYAATKAGLVGFTKSVARELAPRGVTVNAVAPGFIDTDMTSGLPQAQKTALLEQIPLGRLGDASDVAAAVAYLAGSDAAYVTGQTLHINGGMLMD